MVTAYYASGFLTHACNARHVITENFARTAAGIHEAKRLHRQEYKRCGHCQQIKAHQEFDRNARRWDGRQSVCRVCRKAARKQV